MFTFAISYHAYIKYLSVILVPRMLSDLFKHEACFNYLCYRSKILCHLHTLLDPMFGAFGNSKAMSVLAVMQELSLSFSSFSIIFVRPLGNLAAHICAKEALEYMSYYFSLSQCISLIMNEEKVLLVYFF